MTVRNAGPAGSGLIPPVGKASKKTSDDLDDEDQDDLESEDEDIDGVPPVEDEDDVDGDESEDDNDTDDEDLDARVAEIERRLTETFQRRFDRAVTKMQRKLRSQPQVRQSEADPEEDDDDDDEAGSPPPKKRRRPASVSRNADVTSIRLLARDMVTDQMDKAGTKERAVVKSVLDAVIPVVDWGQVDEEDFVEDLVLKLKEASTELVRTGSDRKLAQLRRMGLISERQGQPSGQGRRAKTDVSTQMAKGAAAAKERFPDGTRRHLR